MMKEFISIFDAIRARESIAFPPEEDNTTIEE
jgi:hypothetical protein